MALCWLVQRLGCKLSRKLVLPAGITGWSYQRGTTAAVSPSIGRDIRCGNRFVDKRNTSETRERSPKLEGVATVGQLQSEKRKQRPSRKGKARNPTRTTKMREIGCDCKSLGTNFVRVTA